MTRLASFCSGVLEVVNAVTTRLEDVIGEWVDGLAPRPTVDTRARDLLSRWNSDDLIKWSGNARDGEWIVCASNERIEALIDDTGEYLDAIVKGRR